MMVHVPAIPESTRSSIILRLLDHAEKNWPQLAKVRARYHGSFAYITGVLPSGEQIPLFRLRYGGSAHSFGFAIYSPARDRYEDAVLLTGLPIGSPQEALDTACTVHLAALGHEPESWPPTDLRCHPLRAGHYYMRKGPKRFLFRPRQVCMVEGGSCGRGSQLMDCSLGQALQGNLAIVTRIRPEVLDGPRPEV
jgi:hypothetical protein